MKILAGLFVFSLIAVSTHNIPVGSSSYSSDLLTTGMGDGGGYSTQPQSLTTGAGGGGGFQVNTDGTTNGAGGGGN